MEWWEAMTILERVCVCIAIPATLLLIIQTILTIIGIDGGVEADADVDIDIEVDSDGADLDVETPDGELGFHLFTVRGTIAFLAVMGWMGYALLSAGVRVWLSCLIAVASGFVMMVLVALIFRFFSKLQTNGNVDIRKAVGTSGSVYLTVPAKRQGTGKINVVVQDKYSEYEAVTDEEEAIPYGSEVVVIGLSGLDTLVVKRK